ncbi:hypothetical protein HDK64DRAFT_324456 [Phyllosticta capitalensis]
MHTRIFLLVFLLLVRLAATAEVGPFYFAIESPDPPGDPWLLPCCGDKIKGGDMCAVVNIVQFGKITDQPHLCLQRTDAKRNGNLCPDQNCRTLLNKYEGFQILGPKCSRRQRHTRANDLEFKLASGTCVKQGWCKISTKFPNGRLKAVQLRSPQTKSDNRDHHLPKEVIAAVGQNPQQQISQKHETERQRFRSGVALPAFDDMFRDRAGVPSQPTLDATPKRHSERTETGPAATAPHQAPSSTPPVPPPTKDVSGPLPHPPSLESLKIPSIKAFNFNALRRHYSRR